MGYNSVPDIIGLSSFV